MMTQPDNPVAREGGVARGPAMTSAARVRVSSASPEAAVTGTRAGARGDALGGRAGRRGPASRADGASRPAQGPRPRSPAHAPQAAPVGVHARNLAADRHFPAHDPTPASPPSSVTANNGNGARGVQQPDVPGFARGWRPGARGFSGRASQRARGEQKSERGL
jgi:hypothetical protein